MSFILDALKKSEIERQRQSVPGLVHSGIARPRTRLPMWAIALCALLAVNLIVLSVVLLRERMGAPASSSVNAGAQTSPAGVATPGVATPGVSTPGSSFSPLDAAPVYAPEIPVTSAAPLPAVAPVVPKVASHRREPLLTDQDSKSDDEEVLPTINEISLTGAQALPELHLDVHVYATRSAERFVYVNMRKYHEGAVLQEGPTVEHIRRDGVVLNYHALRFLLPRQ
ncbi:MAG: general secretion pathway protein GspB [Pseudomonadota bacterium]|nr:general secretion pathway protein GspB [Pseudomonadota bacterium]